MFFTYVVGIDDQLNDVLWVHVEDFNCRSRNEGSIILQQGKKKPQNTNKRHKGNYFMIKSLIRISWATDRKTKLPCKWRNTSSSPQRWDRYYFRPVFLQADRERDNPVEIETFLYHNRKKNFGQTGSGWKEVITILITVLCLHRTPCQENKLKEERPKGRVREPASYYITLIPLPVCEPGFCR